MILNKKYHMDTLKRLFDDLNNEYMKLLSIDYKFIDRVEYKNKIDEINKNINLLYNQLSLLEKPFLLCITGCGNYGKSTLIKNFINLDLISTSPIPNT